MPHHKTRSNPGLTITVLNPTATFSDDINQNSIVVKMTRRSVSFLFMGDANADAETRVANNGTILQADIPKVGHHGSATSSSSAFLSKVQPKTRIIEVGAGNSYGHPTSAALGHLAQVGSAVYSTDLNGDVTVTTDGTTYDVKTSQLVSGSAKTGATQQTVSSQSTIGAVCDCSYN